MIASALALLRASSLTAKLVLALAIFAAVGGAYWSWKHSIENAVIVERDLRDAKKTIENIRRGGEAAKDFEHDATQQGVDCILHARGWLTGPKPEGCP